MQVISKEDKAAYDQCITMYQQSACAPLMLSFDSHEGFVVESDSVIKYLTIVVEYIGDVDYIRKRKRDNEVSIIMGLLLTNSLDKDRIICLNKEGHIAQFVSSIINHTREGKKKQNLRCIRFNIEGKAHALLISISDRSLTNKEPAGG